MKVLLVIGLVVALVAGDATPDIQLVGFDDLFKLTQGVSSNKNSDAMEPREDRSLLNTFPFNQVEDTSYSQGGASHVVSHHTTGRVASGGGHLSTEAGGHLSRSQAIGRRRIKASGLRSSSHLSGGAGHLFGGAGHLAGGASHLAGGGTHFAGDSGTIIEARGRLAGGSSGHLVGASSGHLSGASSGHLFGTSGHLDRSSAASAASAGASGVGFSHALSQAYAQGNALPASGIVSSGLLGHSLGHGQTAVVTEDGSSVAFGSRLFNAQGGFAQFGGASLGAQPAFQLQQYALTQPALQVGGSGGVAVHAVDQLPSFQHFSSGAGGGVALHQQHITAAQPAVVQQAVAPAVVQHAVAPAVVQHAVAPAVVAQAPVVNTHHVQHHLEHLEPVAAPVVEPARRRQQFEITAFNDLDFNPNRARNPAQGREAGPSLEAVAVARERCIDKIEQVEQIEYDDVEECNHSYDRKCHTSYSTEYDNQQEVECEDNYRKECKITYSPSAHNETVKVCSRPLIKDCNLNGPVECRTEYVSECWTKQEEHTVVDDVPECETVYEEKCRDEQNGYTTETKCTKWPKEVCSVNKKLNKKVTPKTRCDKVPQKFCGPAGCGFVQGPEECYDKVKTIVTDVPNEVCDLQPRVDCGHVNKLVPKLVPVEECVDVPKEVCNTVRGPPRTVLKPVTKKWCYTPSEESGLL